MEREIAERLMVTLHGLNAQLNKAMTLIEQITDDTEKQTMRRALGELAGASFTDVMLPIIKQYPDLDPDKDAEWYRKLKGKTVGSANGDA